MSTRVWSYPDLRNGTTLNHISDTHFGAHGNADWLRGWMDRMAVDLEALKADHVGHAHTGDCIHWDHPADVLMEDGWFRSWRQRVMDDSGLPMAVAPGNHDLNSFADENRYRRTSAQWAQAINIPAANTVTQMGDMRVISIGPDSREASSGWEMSSTTMQFLDDSLTEAGSTPCWVSFHCPLAAQFDRVGNHWYTDVANPDLLPIMDAHDNCIGSLNGHLHANIDGAPGTTTPPNNFRSFSIGSRRIFAINGPPAGGGRYAAVAYADHQWNSPCQSVFVTYLGDAVDVRWRDHLSRSWTTSKGDKMRHILISEWP